MAGNGCRRHVQSKIPSYDEAVKFVHMLGMTGQKGWQAYCRGERADLVAKPVDIPADPARVYSDDFHKRGGWGAWLGTGTVATYNRQYRSYDNAVKFVHLLALKSRREWLAYCRGERRDLPELPADIPRDPVDVYNDEFRARGGLRAWLGTAGKVTLRPALQVGSAHWRCPAHF
jgi:hypothetical protein